MNEGDLKHINRIGIESVGVFFCQSERLESNRRVTPKPDESEVTSMSVARNKIRLKDNYIRSTLK